MEIADGADGKKPPDGWKKTPEGSSDKAPKRMMKSPYQLEVLEKTYAVESYPSEALRADLSAKIGLSDRQLQMWFCHRRLKDRKYPPVKRQRKDDSTSSPPMTAASMQVTGGELAVGSASGSGSSPSPSPFPEPRKRMVGRAAARIVTDMPPVALGRRYYESAPMLSQMVPPPPQQLSLEDMRVIASVEAQLGEPLREDGPILGVEFDPLPPGAFGAPIESDPPAVLAHGHMATHHFLDRLENPASTGHLKQLARAYDGKLFDRHDTKSIKASSFVPSMDNSFVPSSSSGKRKSTAGVVSQVGQRALHEYQFLPEQPTVRGEIYERASHSHYYDSSVEVPSSRLSSLPTGDQFLHGNEQLPPSYTFQGQMSSSDLLSQHGRQQMFSGGSTEYENTQQNSTYPNTLVDPQYGMSPVMGLENPYLSSDRRIFRNEDGSRTVKKRKNDEAKIAKEVEAQAKRIRKEIEKQDILRRKREEQLRREMERHDRERKKEEERLMREKLREEEKFLREQKRENDRKEKLLLRESLKAEKKRRKEEKQREKEAARLKAANERATARRIAREYMELVEDERLELMELAASTKGLPSMIALDSETLQQLDMFRGMLSVFPPASVSLKRPFAMQPWTNSEENSGNLLMVWKFLITFADVLELWPFTLDEFVQALHDYDSRLLGEIHVALLKSIIKDIEDVARTPTFSLAANQNSAANPGGGHPQIVEGAYAWGFDIRRWKRHLNFLTWPEILRQFALSAGFGPKLKKGNAEHAYFHDDNEGNDGEDVIMNLRSGAAAESAVAWMHEKGFTRRRRSRHRLTPGTVKFAAFHVLSLEGSKGLTILEVADKIQKSGLRDLRTSKTPEASIAAALSRDTKLFERTAPSTYCVRSPYRKDPADADAILAAAREKIQVFQSGLSDSEEAEKDAEDADDAERDEDTDCDGDDDPEVEDATSTKAEPSKKLSASIVSKDTKVSPPLEDNKAEIVLNAVDAPCDVMNIDKGFSLQSSEKSKDISASGVSNDQSAVASSNCHGGGNPDQDDIEVDESNCEPWVQGLTEDEYCDLSVEERLNALVSLIGVAIEGNMIRVILEERLEAANALKKQMWAEAQLDKRRLREEYASKYQYSSAIGYKVEPSQVNARTEGSPLDGVDNKGNDENLESINNDQYLDSENLGNVNNVPDERNLVGQEFSTNPDTVQLQQYGYAAEKSRSQLKSYIGHKAEEMYVYRSLPLGQDRRRNRYWLFSTSVSRNDPGSGRIFFESRDGLWRLIDSEEAFDALVSALDTRGVRESHLHSMLQRIEATFKETIKRGKSCNNSMEPVGGLGKTGTSEVTCSSDCSNEFDSPSSTLCGLNADTVEHSSSFRIELGRNEAERNAALKRYQGFLRWMWKESYNPFILCALKYGKKRCPELLQTCHICYQSYFTEEKHCPACHKTFKILHNADANFSEHVAECEEKQKMDANWKIFVSDATPIRVRLLKAQIALIEVSIPVEALQPFWTEGYRRSWGVKLQLSSSAEELFQVLTLLETAIKRDCLSSNFETTSELLGSSKLGIAATISVTVPVLPWVPDTTAAITLRLLDLDASISYMLQQKLDFQKDREAAEFIKLPSRYAVVKNTQEGDPSEVPDMFDYQREGRWLDAGSGRRGCGRGNRGRGGGRGRGRGRGQRMLASSTRMEFKDGGSIGTFIKPTRKYTRRGKARGRGRGRGRRTIRPRPRLGSRIPIVKHKLANHFMDDMGSASKHENIEEAPFSLGRDEWCPGERRAYLEAEENSVESESEDQAQAPEDEYEDRVMDYPGDYGASKPVGLMDDLSEEEDGDGDGDEDGEDDDGIQDGPEEMLIEEDEDDEEEIGDEDGEEVGDGEGNGDEDDGASSYSSDYSG